MDFTFFTIRTSYSWRCTYGVSICSEILYKLLRYKIYNIFPKQQKNSCFICR